MSPDLLADLSTPGATRPLLGPVAGRVTMVTEDLLRVVVDSISSLHYFEVQTWAPRVAPEVGDECLLFVDEFHRPWALLPTAVGGEPGPEGPAGETGPAGATGADGVGLETGDIIWSGRTSKTGALPCDGSAVSRTTYATLFAEIGTTFGAGDGTTTFNVPDLRGRAPVGAGTGAGLSARALAATFGEETHVLSTTEMPSHTHPPAAAGAVGFVTAQTSGADVALASGSTVGVNWTANTATGSRGDDGAHNNMQPSLALNAFILT